MPSQSHRRARPLPPDERRAALIAATVPLIIEHGQRVSTRQIAVAAGVAEGTIYRAFPDKDSLLRAALDSAFDPAGTVRRLDEIDPGRPLAERLAAAVDILRDRLEVVFSLFSAFGVHGSAPALHRRQPPPNQELELALARLLEQDADRLRLSADRAARYIRVLVFAGAHPRLNDNVPMPTAEIVDLLLHGVVHPPSTHSARGADEC